MRMLLRREGFGVRLCLVMIDSLATLPPPGYPFSFPRCQGCQHRWSSTPAGHFVNLHLQIHQTIPQSCKQRLAQLPLRYRSVESAGSRHTSTNALRVLSASRSNDPWLEKRLISGVAVLWGAARRTKVRLALTTTSKYVKRLTKVTAQNCQIQTVRSPRQHGPTRLSPVPVHAPDLTDDTDLGIPPMTGTVIHRIEDPSPLKSLTEVNWPPEPDPDVFTDPLLREDPKPLRREELMRIGRSPPTALSMICWITMNDRPGQLHPPTSGTSSPPRPSRASSGSSMPSPRPTPDQQPSPAYYRSMMPPSPYPVAVHSSQSATPHLPWKSCWHPLMVSGRSRIGDGVGRVGGLAERGVGREGPGSGRRNGGS